MAKIDRNNKKNEIADAALALFVKNGFDRTSIRMIAKRADISLGLMYNYFESKEDLLQFLISNGFKAVQDSFDTAETQHSPDQMLPALLATSFNSIQAHRQFWRLYYTLRMQPAILQRLSLESASWPEFLQEQLTRYFRARKVDEPEASALALSAAIDGIAQHYVLAPSRFPIKIAIQILLTGFSRA